MMLGIGTDEDAFCDPWREYGVREVLEAYRLGALSYSYAYQIITTCFEYPYGQGYGGLAADEMLRDAASRPPDEPPMEEPPMEEPPAQNPPIDPPEEEPPTQNPPTYPPLPEPPVPEPEPPTSGFPPADDRTSCEYWTPRGFQAALDSFTYEHQHPGHGDLTESEFRIVADKCHGESQNDIDDYVAEVKGLPILIPDDDPRDEEIDTERTLEGQPSRFILMVIGAVVAGMIGFYVFNTVKGAAK